MLLRACQEAAEGLDNSKVKSSEYSHSLPGNRSPLCVGAGRFPVLDVEREAEVEVGV
jgi:hypothetical protein